MSTIPDLGTLGAAHRAVWASGDYPAVAAELIPGLGEVVVDTAAVGPGDRVLDIAAGTAVRFEPGQRREVTLVDMAGARRIYGFNQAVMGAL